MQIDAACHSLSLDAKLELVPIIALSEPTVAYPQQSQLYHILMRGANISTHEKWARHAAVRTINKIINEGTPKRQQAGSSDGCCAVRTEVLHSGLRILERGALLVLMDCLVARWHVSWIECKVGL